jgi:hypothetical protein
MMGFGPWAVALIGCCCCRIPLIVYRLFIRGGGSQRILHRNAKAGIWDQHHC